MLLLPPLLLLLLEVPHNPVLWLWPLPSAAAARDTAVLQNAAVPAIRQDVVAACVTHFPHDSTEGGGGLPTPAQAP
jgi:hypothetical protein